MPNLEDRVVTVNDSKMYRFNSREDLKEHFLHELEKEFFSRVEKDQSIPRPRIEDIIIKYGGTIERDVDNLWKRQITSFHKTVYLSSFETSVYLQANTMFYQYQLPYMPTVYDEAIERARATTAKSELPSAIGSSGGTAEKGASARIIPWGVAVLGGVAAIHGTVAAAVAIDPITHRRDWRKTALHSAEALVGLAGTWASIVALRGHPMQR